MHTHCNTLCIHSAKEPCVCIQQPYIPEVLSWMSQKSLKWEIWGTTAPLKRGLKCHKRGLKWDIWGTTAPQAYRAVVCTHRALLQSAYTFKRALSLTAYIGRLIYMCDMPHLYVWHDSFICVTWVIHMCDMSHSYVWHASFICVTWLIHMCEIQRERLLFCRLQT